MPPINCQIEFSSLRTKILSNHLVLFRGPVDSDSKQSKLM